MVQAYALVAKRFHSTERAVRWDWENRETWIHTVLPLHAGNLEQFPNQSFAGVRYARGLFTDLQKKALAAKRAIVIPVRIVEDRIDEGTGKVLRTAKTGGKIEEVDAPDVRTAVEAARGFLDTVIGEAKIAGSLLAARVGSDGIEEPLSPDEERRAIAAAKSLFGEQLPAIPMYAQRIDAPELVPVAAPGVAGEEKANPGRLDLLEELLGEERGER